MVCSLTVGLFHGLRELQGGMTTFPEDRALELRLQRQRLRLGEQPPASFTPVNPTLHVKVVDERTELQKLAGIVSDKSTAAAIQNQNALLRAYEQKLVFGPA
jgi:hypothetical protein